MVKGRKTNIFCLALFLLMSMLSASSCFRTLMISNKKEQLLSNESAVVNITVKFDNRFFYILTVKSMKNEIEVHPKELKLTSTPLAEFIKISEIRYNKKTVLQPFKLKQGEIFESKFTVTPNMQEGVTINEIHVLPGNFITSHGVPLITDTIKITVY